MFIIFGRNVSIVVTHKANDSFEISLSYTQRPHTMFFFFHNVTVDISMGESNTIVSAYTLCSTYNSIVSPMYNSKLKESVDDKLDVAKKWICL